MRSTIAFLLCIAVAQLSHLTVESFSLLQATRVIAPTKSKVERATVNKVEKVVAKKVVKVTAKSVAKGKTKGKTKAVASSKIKAVAAAKAKAGLKASAKAKAAAALKANATIKTKNKAAEQAKVKAAAVAKAKGLEKAKKTAAAKARNIKQTTSATAFNVANSGKDPALAIAKNFKPKKNNGNQPLFPGLQAGTKKRPVSTFAKKIDDSEKANNVVAKKASTSDGTVNPIEFGLQVAKSEKGQEAAAILIEGGLKLVEAILAEGKKTKVVIPRGFDTGTGDLKKPKITNVGYKELLDAGIFAGTEFFDVAKNNYEKLYVGGSGKEKVKITRTAAKIDKKTGKVLVPVKENYVVKIGGERVLVNRPLR